MTVEILIDGYPSIVYKKVADYFTALEAERDELRAQLEAVRAVIDEPLIPANGAVMAAFMYAKRLDKISRIVVAKRPQPDSGKGAG